MLLFYFFLGTYGQSPEQIRMANKVKIEIILKLGLKDFQDFLQKKDDIFCCV